MGGRESRLGHNNWALELEDRKISETLENRQGNRGTPQGESVFENRRFRFSGMARAIRYFGDRAARAAPLTICAACKTELPWPDGRVIIIRLLLKTQSQHFLQPRRALHTVSQTKAATAATSKYHAYCCCRASSVVSSIPFRRSVSWAISMSSPTCCQAVTAVGSDS